MMNWCFQKQKDVAIIKKRKNEANQKYRAKLKQSNELFKSCDDNEEKADLVQNDIETNKDRSFAMTDEVQTLNESVDAVDFSFSDSSFVF